MGVKDRGSSLHKRVLHTYIFRLDYSIILSISKKKKFVLTIATKTTRSAILNFEIGYYP